MEYKDEQGNLYKIGYSQKLQEELLENYKDGNRLKRILIGVLVAGLLVLFLIFGMLLLLQFKGGHLGFIIKNLVC
jgi:hypothetical protein